MWEINIDLWIYKNTIFSLRGSNAISARKINDITNVCGKGTLENRRIITRRAVLRVVNDNPVTYELHMRRAAASSCAMRMHLVLQNTGEQRPRSRRYELSLVRFNSTGLLARPWYHGVDQTCLSLASSRLPLSMHSVYRVECRLGGPNLLKTFALSLSNASSQTSSLHFWNYRIFIVIFSLPFFRDAFLTRVRSLRLNANHI